MNYANVQPFVAHASNATFSSAALDSSYMFKVSAILHSSHSSAAGTLQLQGSNQPPSSAVPSQWSNLGSAAAVSGAGETLIAQQDVAYRWLRWTYTDSSGAASTSQLTLNIFGFTF